MKNLDKLSLFRAKKNDLSVGIIDISINDTTIISLRNRQIDVDYIIINTADFEVRTTAPGSRGAFAVSGRNTA